MSSLAAAGSSRLLWGAATSAFQIEGAARADGKGPSVWDMFCAEPGRIAGGDTGETACDHYRRWREDVGLIRALGLNAYRFSVSWPRVQPEGRGRVNPAGLGFYDRLVDELRGAGIEPMVTLYHWDLPAALQTSLGGWANDDLPQHFSDYAGRVFDTLGDRVRLWLTLNEPWVVVDGGYFHGVHPPGLRDRRLGYRVGHNLLRAHACAAARYRASQHGDGAISLALNATHSAPATDSPVDAAAAERAMQDFAGWFGDPLYFGDYPAVMRERLGDLLPRFSVEEQRMLRASADFLALNYYFSDLVRHAPGAGPMEYERVPVRDAPRTAMGWPVTPAGLTRLLHWLHDRYGGPAIYVTENGAAFDDRPDENGFVDDPQRVEYLRDHLAAMEAARSGGVNLRGYFAWSLLDNFEWAEGYSKRFGLVHCDRRTQKRTIKRSGQWYADYVADRRTR